MARRSDNAPKVAENIRKVAVTKQGLNTQFFEFNLSKPINEVIQEIAKGWGFSNADQFALQFDEEKRQTYITDENRLLINNGAILKLGAKPTACADEILRSLRSKEKAEISFALRNLSIMAGDITFTEAFLKLKGLDQLKAMINDKICKNEDLGYLYKSLFDIVDHQIISWNDIEKEVIQTIASFCKKTDNNLDALALQSALDILEDIVSNDDYSHKFIDEDVTCASLVGHLKNDSEQVQRSAIALINALFSTAQPDVQKKQSDELQSKKLRSVIFDQVIKGKPGLKMERAMAHQLYVLQCHLMNQFTRTKDTPVDTNDSAKEKELQQLLTADSDTVRRNRNLGEQYRKLGFIEYNSPLKDFSRCPPGALALRLILDFSQRHPEDYNKVVLENSCRSDEYDLPFIQACIELVNVLCQVLHAGEQPLPDCYLYQPFFFTDEKPFEELFCCCVALFNTTWKDMRATMADLPKVSGVVKEQITRALNQQPTSFENFKQKLATLKYADILNLWQQERRTKEETEAEAKPIQELRAQIKPEMLALIKQQRLNYLVEGGLFNKPGKRKGFTYVRLSGNHKVLTYGDCQEGEKPAQDQLTNKLSVADIKTILWGKDCPHVKDTKDAKKRYQVQHALTIVPEEAVGEQLNLLAQSEEEYNMWNDGLNALMNEEMVSPQVTIDLNTLLNMELKLRLLDTEGIEIPENPPPIPPDPPNMDFLFKL